MVTNWETKPWFSLYPYSMLLLWLDFVFPGSQVRTDTVCKIPHACSTILPQLFAQPALSWRLCSWKGSWVDLLKCFWQPSPCYCKLVPSAVSINPVVVVWSRAANADKIPPEVSTLQHQQATTHLGERVFPVGIAEWSWLAVMNSCTVTEHIKSRLIKLGPSKGGEMWGIVLRFSMFKELQKIPQFSYMLPGFCSYRIIEYAELEGSHWDHQVQLLALGRTSQESSHAWKLVLSFFLHTLQDSKCCLEIIYGNIVALCMIHLCCIQTT